MRFPEWYPSFPEAPVDSAAGQKALEEAKEILNDMWVKMTKANKGCTTIFLTAEAIEEPSDRLASTTKDLETSLQNLENTLGDLGYLLKFQKRKTGVKLTGAVGKEVSHMCAKGLSDCLGCARSCKALFPKPAICK